MINFLWQTFDVWRKQESNTQNFYFISRSNRKRVKWNVNLPGCCRTPVRNVDDSQTVAKMPSTQQAITIFLHTCWLFIFLIFWFCLVYWNKKLSPFIALLFNMFTLVSIRFFLVYFRNGTKVQANNEYNVLNLFFVL